MARTDLHQRQEALRDRLLALETELAEVHGALVSLGPGTSLPGLYLQVEAAGLRALLPSARVREIVRLVAFDPLPVAHRPALGSFVWRGQAAVAVDMATLLGADREPGLDAHVVVLGGARLCGLVVDGVRSLVDSPVQVQPSAAGTLEAWAGGALVEAWCQVDGDVVPLLSTRAIEDALGVAT